MLKKIGFVVFSIIVGSGAFTPDAEAGRGRHAPRGHAYGFWRNHPVRSARTFRPVYRSTSRRARLLSVRRTRSRTIYCYRLGNRSFCQMHRL